MKKKLTDLVSVDELKQMYDNGMSCEDIASKLKVGASTVYRYLSGHTVGRAKGGKIASKIPKDVIQPKSYDDQHSFHDMAIQNAANACLVVVDHSINLKGQYGEYLVEPGKKKVTVNVQGEVFDLGFDVINGFIEELKAIGRNIGSVSVGNEMW